MSGTIKLKPVDLAFYAENLRDFLPPRIIDIHAHIWRGPATARPDSRVQSWPSAVAAENTVENLLESYRLLLPGKDVTALVFGMPTDLERFEEMNLYAAAAAKDHNLPALSMCRPEWSADELERRLCAGGFVGIKPYLTLAPGGLRDQIGIFDFLPHHQLKVLNRRRGIVILHLPRPGRLRDPANLDQLLQIEDSYGDAQVVVVHVGRAYCAEDIGDAFAVLGRTKRLCFDISANTNAEVFARLLDAVGPRRVLFGSDLPIVRMRMRRICERGVYVNLVPRGMYGDVSGDPHMRELDGPEAGRLTLFLYEEIMALRQAAQACGLSSDDILDIFCGNATRLLERAQAVKP